MTEALRHLRLLLRALEFLDRHIASYELEEADVLRRVAAQRWCVDVGNACEGYRRALEIDAGVEPWASPVMLRNKLAHQPSWELDDAVVWDAARRLLPQLRDVALNLLEELEPPATS